MCRRMWMCAVRKEDICNGKRFLLYKALCRMRRLPLLWNENLFIVKGDYISWKAIWLLPEMDMVAVRGEYAAMRGRYVCYGRHCIR